MATLDINVKQVNADFQAIKNKIVEKGVEVADGTKTSEYADKVGAVYEAGVKSEYDRFWDEIQRNGDRTYYEYGFCSWGVEYIRPKYKVIPTSRILYLFASNPLLKVVEKDYFDLSQVTISPTQQTYGLYATFRQCSNLETIEDIGIPSGYLYDTFRYCRKLHTIEVLRIDSDAKIQSTTFGECVNLQNLTIEGTIGQNGFKVSESPKLTHDSLMSIINALQDKTTDTSGTSWVCTLGATNLAKLTDAEKAIATQKGWTLA